MDRKPVVYVVDDDLEVREALQLTLEMMDFEVVAAASGQEFLDRYEPGAIGCLVVDLRMAGMSGLQLLTAMSERDIRIPAVMISGHGDVPAAVQAMKEGVIDFLEKPYRIDALRESVRRGVQMHRANQAEEQRQSQLRDRLDRLSATERDVLELTVAGLPDKAIAARTGVSLRTVQLRRASLIKKLGVESRIDLVRISQMMSATGTV